MKNYAKYSKRQKVKSSENKSDWTKTSYIELKNTEKRLCNKRKKPAEKRKINHKTNRSTQLSESKKTESKDKRYSNIKIMKNCPVGGVKAEKQCGKQNIFSEQDSWKNIPI